MNPTMGAKMEDVPLEDVDESSMEYKVLMAFAQRSLSAIHFQELVKSTSSTLSANAINGKPLAGKSGHGGEESKDHAPSTSNQTSETSSTVKRKKSNWRRRIIPQCFRGQRQRDDDVDGPRGSHDVFTISPESSMESAIHAEEEEPKPETVEQVAERLVELLHEAPEHSHDPEHRNLKSSTSVEADGATVEHDEDQVIRDIVALLRESGDRMDEKIKADKTLCNGITELFTSYNYFRKLTDLYLGDGVPEDPKDAQQQGTKMAMAMDVTTKLTAIDNHPMNKVLGFGIKYLKENFSPWIHDNGGWEKALGVKTQAVD
ncbi:apoptosis facilitator Bcl-2-like protein 14 [Ambystoma mexicanum]|uniref:apoptosis facilitator Bcl-2-like protein 14 n=1 Tax=Ambystoma mexicanum TaxID=8296 RepID=UPI0037E9135A